MEVREASASYSGLSELQNEAVPFGYKQTEVGIVPKDWDLAKLGDYVTFRTGPFGSALHKSDYVEDGVPVINPMQIDNGRIFPTASMAVTEAAARKLADFRLTAGEVIIGRRGEMGRCAVVRTEEAGWLCGTGSMIVRAKPSLDAGFIQRVLSSPPIINAIESASVGSTMINLNQGTLANLRVVLPSAKAEQEAIAEALTDADALIESLEQLIAKKRQIKQGTMQALLTGQRRLPGFMGEWLTRKFGEVAAIRRDRVDPRKSLEPEFCIELEHIGSGTGSLLGSSDAGSQASLKSVFHAGDVLFGKLRAYLRKYWFADRSGVCSTEIWCLTPKEMLHSKALLFYLVQMDEFIDAASLAYGTHMPRSDWNAVKEFVLRIPQDDEEQAAIATILTDMDTELAELETRLAKTRQLKQGMMQELLTGRIRLVQPALNVVPLPEKKETRAAAASPHNRQINEAVVIAALVKQFGSEDWPLARVRRTKLTYLLHRHAEGRADGFLKKAAGPYDPRTRYKGPEGIALKKGYVQALHNGTYEGFVASEHISDAETYFEKWYGTDVMDWLERFRLRKTDELELLTTVDMAMEDLRREGKPISVEAVRQLIHGHPEWKPKLERAIFSDDGIAAAIAECQALFAS